MVTNKFCYISKSCLFHTILTPIFMFYIIANFPKVISKLNPNIKDICRANVKESFLWPELIYVTIKTKPSYFLRQNLLQTEIKVETTNHWI